MEEIAEKEIESGILTKEGKQLLMDMLENSKRKRQSKEKRRTS